MKYLIAYHSKTGNNSKQAQELFNSLKKNNIDVSVLKVMPKRNYPIPVNGFQGVLNIRPKLKEVYNINSFDVIILCGPVWAGTFSPVLTSLINSQGTLKGKKFYISPCCFGDAAKPIGKLSDIIKSKGGTFIGGSYLIANDLKDSSKLIKYADDVGMKCKP